MIFDSDCNKMLNLLGDRPNVFRFNFIPKDYLCYGETLCILSNDSELNAFVLQNYIAEILARNDTRVLYLDASIEFSYSRFKNISESLNVDAEINFDKITYIPIPSPTQLVSVLKILDDYLMVNRQIKVIVVDKLNFWSTSIFKRNKLNKTLNKCYKRLKKLQMRFGLLLIYTKTLYVDQNNVKSIIQSHYDGLLGGIDSKNTIVLIIVPNESDYQVYTFRFKRCFNMNFTKCCVKQVTGFKSYNDTTNECLIDKFCNGEVDSGDEEGICALEEIHQGIIDSKWRKESLLTSKKP